MFLAQENHFQILSLAVQTKPLLNEKYFIQLYRSTAASAHKFFFPTFHLWDKRRNLCGTYPPLCFYFPPQVNVTLSAYRLLDHKPTMSSEPHWYYMFSCDKDERLLVDQHSIEAFCFTGGSFMHTFLHKMRHNQWSRCLGSRDQTQEIAGHPRVTLIGLVPANLNCGSVGHELLWICASLSTGQRDTEALQNIFCWDIKCRPVFV